MAKKARRKLEEEEEAAFEFPVFDEVGFITKEFELTAALLWASLFTVLLGLMGWVLTAYQIDGLIPFTLGILGVIGGLYAIQKLRPRSTLFTKGDWAQLFLLEFFGFLALWFVLTNVSPLL